MTEVKGRKKHSVTGSVAEIKKQEEALNIGQVGEKRSLLTSLFKKVNKDQKKVK